MRAELYKNIDLVQIDIHAGVSEYTFPKNVDWANEKIDHLILVAPTASMVSPMDGTTPVLTAAQISDLYFELYTGTNKELAQSLHYTNLLHTNNQPVRIDSTLSLQLSRLVFTTAPVTDGCLLLYAFYGGRIEENYDMPRNSVTIDVTLKANEQRNLREIIQRTIYADGKKVRGLEIWGGEVKPTYLTLRDYQLSYIISNMYSGLARPLMAGASADKTQTHMFLLDQQDIDFENSYIRNAVNSANTQKITIYF